MWWPVLSDTSSLRSERLVAASAAMQPLGLFADAPPTSVDQAPVWSAAWT
jgi:hypothetical protein